jgi:PEP-CTERM motif-containing protein
MFEYLEDFVTNLLLRKLTLFGIVFAIFPLISRATNITLQGNFTTDDNVQLFSVAIAAPAAVDIRSYGYAGGTTSTGTAVPRGGFDTILTLFNASGVFIDDNDDGAGAAIDPITGQAADARITANLAAGSYILALTQYDNFSIGNLADGFGETGNPHFTTDPGFGSGGACPGNMFRDISGTAGRCRTANWALDFVNVSSVMPAAAVPEPSALLLAGFGLALLLVGRFRARRKATLLTGALVAALASVPIQAQTKSGPDYSQTSDFLNGQRTLLQVTDLQIVTQTRAFNGTDIYPITTSNSGQTLQPTQSPSGSVDPDKDVRVFSAHMFNQASASTLWTMANFEESGNFALGLRNVDSLHGAEGNWDPLPAGSNPTVTADAVADFTLDGYDDLALSFDDGRLLVLTPKDVNNVYANFNEAIVSVEVLKALAAGDFKGDGRREIAGISITSNGGPQLVIYTVDPTSLAITNASSLVLTAPSGASASNPVTYVSMARGRFNSAGHDQLAVTFATNSGPSIVEIIDFAPNTLNPVEGPQLSASSVTIPTGFLEVQTGQFALPGSSYDQIVFHISSISDGGKFFELISADPTSLVLTAHSGISYNPYPCSSGTQVGNFDHRQPDPLNPGRTQPNPNAQVALLYCRPSQFPPLNGYTLNIYSADPNTLVLNNNAESALQLPDGTLNDQHNSPPAFVATDLQGRSVTLGAPTKITINNTIQPSAVVGVPPMHVDFIDSGDGNGPKVFNVSVVPDGFKTTYNQESSTSDASSTTNATSWSFGAKETASVGFTIGDPDTDGLKGTDTFTAAQTLKGSHEHDHGTYTGKSYNVSATTGFGDEVSYTDSQFNIWVYPVIGKTVCPAKPNPCTEKVPLYIQFSAPDGDSQQPEAVQGQALQWYQPPWEPGNIFSYPANLDQLKAHYPDVQQLTNDTTGFLTDGSTLTQTATWSGSGEESDSTGLKQNYSFENDFSVNGSVGFEGITAQAGFGLDVSGSFGFNNLFKSTTTLGKSTGLQISKPGTFPTFQNYGYSVKPYIMGTMQPGGVVDNQPLSADIQTIGLLRAVFTADPLSQDPAAGGWWQQAYTAAPDVALNHPSRWTYTATAQPSSGDPPANCLLTGDGKSMDCAELSQRSPGNPWLDIFHFMRGFFISSGVSPGQGPQLEQAKAGDVLTLQARVYNYSLVPMPDGTEVHARFYFMPWNTTRNLPAEPNGNSYLISEEKVAAIREFNESTGPNAQPNWTLVSTTFDTSKFQETKDGNAHLVFWVVVWMQDGNGNLIAEMPGHGLTAIPPAGTANSNGETTVHFSGPQGSPGVAQSEECQLDGNCYGNNLGLYKQVFYIAPNAVDVTPLPATASLDIGKVDVSANQVTPRDTVVLSATLLASGGAASGVSVNFYDGDPDKGGRLFAVERIPNIAVDAQHLVQTTYKSNACGVHQLFAVVNRGRSSEVVRRAHPVRVDCKGF